jgi:hypothetical protein
LSFPPYALILGGFQDSEGNPLADGTLTARLSSDSYLGAISPAVTSSTLICAGQELIYQLDSNGNVSTNPLQFIYPNDFLTNALPNTGFNSPNVDTLETFYKLTAYSEEGLLSWGPNTVSLVSTLANSFIQRDILTATGSQTVYTLTFTPLTNSLYVFRNGVFQTVGVDYSLSGQTLTFFSAPLSSDLVVAVYTISGEISVILPTYQVQSLFSGSTVYTLTQTPSPNTVTVFQNGIFQSPGVDYNISGAVITFIATTFGPVFVVYQSSPGLSGTTGQVPVGTVNGVNPTFTLATVPDSSSPSLMLFDNGLYQTAGSTFDYTLTANVINFNTASIPVPNSTLYAVYNVPLSISLSVIAPINPT